MQKKESICQYFRDKTSQWWYGYRLNRFPGNKWDKPLGDDELQLLYYFFKELSFLRDYIGKYISHKIEKCHTEGP